MSNFILDILRILAWPMALLVLAFIFRNEIRKLVLYQALPKERKLNVRLAENLDEAQMIADSLLEESGVEMNEEQNAKNTVFVARNDLIQRLAQSSPRAAIIETWVEVEAVLLDVAYNAEIFSRGPMASRRVLDRLIETGVVSSRMLSLYKWMRDIRNKATHLPDGAIEKGDAERYCDLSNIMIEILNQGQGATPKKPVESIRQTFSD